MLFKTFTMALLAATGFAAQNERRQTTTEAVDYTSLSKQL